MLRLQAVALLGLALISLGTNAHCQEAAPTTRPLFEQKCPSGYRQRQVDNFINRAREGDADAQFWAGVSFEQGWCGKPDPTKAVAWYRLSAARGNQDAQNSLGQMYEEGRVVKRDYALAAKWYLRAAEHVPDLGGAAQGRNNLGMLYLRGLGVPKDYVRAYVWFRLARAEANLSEAKAQMTPSEVLEAEQIAEAWSKTHQAR